MKRIWRSHWQGDRWILVKQQNNKIYSLLRQNYWSKLPGHYNILGFTNRRAKLLMQRRYPNWTFMIFLKDERRKSLTGYKNTKNRAGFFKELYPRRILRYSLTSYNNHYPPLSTRPTASSDYRFNNFYFLNLTQPKFKKEANLSPSTSARNSFPTSSQTTYLKNMPFILKHTRDCINNNFYQYGTERVQVSFPCSETNTKNSHIDVMPLLQTSIPHSDNTFWKPTFSKTISIKKSQNINHITFSTTQSSHYFYTLKNAVTSHISISEPLKNKPTFYNDIGPTKLNNTKASIPFTPTYSEIATLPNNTYIQSHTISLNSNVRTQKSQENFNKFVIKHGNEMLTTSLTTGVIICLPKINITNNHTKRNFSLLNFRKKLNCPAKMVCLPNSKRYRNNFTNLINATRTFPNKTQAVTQISKTTYDARNFSLDTALNYIKRISISNRNTTVKPVLIKQNPTHTILNNFGKFHRKQKLVSANLSSGTSKPEINQQTKHNSKNNKYNTQSKRFSRTEYDRIKEKVNTSTINAPKKHQNLKSKFETKQLFSTRYNLIQNNSRESAIMKIYSSDLNKRILPQQHKLNPFSKIIFNAFAVPELPIEIYFKKVVEPKST